jgi:hypothetical protein
MLHNERIKSVLSQMKTIMLCITDRFSDYIKQTSV